jgi:hypothetical protein
VGAAHRLGLPAAADALRALSRRALDSRGILPTPRQINTWRSLDVLLSLLQPLPHGSAPSDAVAVVERLARDLADACALGAESGSLEAQRPALRKPPKPTRQAFAAPA